VGQFENITQRARRSQRILLDIRLCNLCVM
jgi:hypothetical protein